MSDTVYGAAILVSMTVLVVGLLLSWVSTKRPVFWALVFSIGLASSNGLHLYRSVTVTHEGLGWYMFYGAFVAIGLVMMGLYGTQMWLNHRNNNMEGT